MSQPTATLDRLVSRAGQLYSLPAVAMKVLELTGNPQIDTHALRACIENDPALTTKILRVVNSSLFGLSRQVSDLNQALTLLGTKPLKLLVLGFSLPDGLFSGVAADVLGQYWRHTLTKAVAAREIAETLWRQPGDDAFIVALLQDLGMLLLMQVLGEPYLRFVRRVQASGRDLAVLEAETMGFDHTALSARLLAYWRLPESLSRNVSWKELQQSIATPTPGAPPLPRILHLAELTARLLADGHPDVLGQLLQTGREYRELTQPQLEALVSDLEHKVGQLADVLRLELPTGHEYREVLVQAHLRLAEVAAEAAGELLQRSRNQRAESPDVERLADEMTGLSKAVARLCQPEDFDTAGRGRRRSMRHPAMDGPPAPLPAPFPVAAGTPTGPAALRDTVTAAAGIRAVDIEADPGLIGQLSAAVTACRQARCALSLLLVEPGSASELLLTRGVEGAGSVRRLLERACRDLDHDGLICLPHGEWGFAVILPDCDRQRAVRLGNELIDRIRRIPSGGAPGIAVGLGAASVTMPPKNFPAGDLLDAANRCLYGSHASAGGVVKSIEIY